MSNRRALSGLIVGGFGAAGLLAAHNFDYFLLFRNPVTRAHILQQTGHGYLPTATGLAVAAAIVAGVVALALGATGGRRSRGPSLGRLVATLIGAQVAGFVGLETVERLVADVPLHHVLTPLLAVGIGVQAVVATACALIVVALRAVGEVVAERVAAVRPRAVSVPWRPSWFMLDSRPRQRAGGRRRSSRAPPALAI